MSFDELIEQLADLLEVDLFPDGNNACQLVIDNNIAIQLEPDATQDNLLIASSLFELPPGRYREQVLKSALIANGSLPPPIAILSFYEKDSFLTLFRFLPMRALTPQKLNDYLSEFLALALDWQQALQSGQSAPVKTYLTQPRDTKLN